MKIQNVAIALQFHFELLAAKIMMGRGKIMNEELSKRDFNFLLIPFFAET